MPVRISRIQDLSMSRLVLTEKVVHSFEADDHVMSIEFKDFQQLGGINIV